MMMLKPLLTKHLLYVLGTVLSILRGFSFETHGTRSPKEPGPTRIRTAVLGAFALIGRFVLQYFCVRNNPKISVDFNNKHLPVTHEPVGQLQLKWAQPQAPDFKMPVLLSQDPHLQAPQLCGVGFS